MAKVPPIKVQVQPELDLEKLAKAMDVVGDALQAYADHWRKGADQLRKVQEAAKVKSTPSPLPITQDECVQCGAGAGEPHFRGCSTFIQRDYEAKFGPNAEADE